MVPFYGTVYKSSLYDLIIPFPACESGAEREKRRAVVFASGKTEKWNNLIINSLWIVFYVEWHQLMARTIRDKLERIVTYWTFRHISNAKMEGFNNKIRWLIKQTYGFRDREYNKIKNLSAAGNFKLKRDMSFCHKPSMRHKKAPRLRCLVF